MKRHSFWNIYNALRLVQILGIILPAVVAVFLKIDGKKWPDWIANLAVWSHEWAGLVVPVGAGITLGAKGLAVFVGPPKVWRIIQRVLNEYRTVAFKMQEGDPVHYYRVTLFKRVCWMGCLRPSLYWSGGWNRWPWSGWLVPVARSMHTTQKTKTMFLAPDDAEHAEGIAGQAWSSDQVIIVNNLPNVNDDSSDENIKEYAKRTFTTEEWVRKRIDKRPLSMALCGIPVEVSNERWGVIVLDSMRAGSIKETSQAWDHYRRLIPMFFGELLRRGST